MTPNDALDPGPGGDFPFAPRLPDGSPDPVRFPTGVHRHRDPKTRRWLDVDLTPRRPDGSPIVPPPITPPPIP